MKSYLGGTCNESTWRTRLIKMLKCKWFDPVVEDWTPECMKEEIRQRKICDYCVYVITPKMTGSFSIAEVVDDSNKRPNQTIFCFLKDDDGVKFTEGQSRSMESVARMVRDNGAYVFESLEQIAGFLNDSKNSWSLICSKADECEARCTHKNVHMKNKWSCEVCKKYPGVVCRRCDDEGNWIN